MRCSACGKEGAQAAPGKLPLCPKCDAKLRPSGTRDTEDETPPPPENAFQVVGSELRQYKSQFLVLFALAGVAAVAMLVFACCVCASFVPTQPP